MSVSKRSYTDMDGKDGAVAASPYMRMFEQFKAELDEHHERRERIIKASRDITAASKKIIFSLQRVRQLGEPIPQQILANNKQYHDIISNQFASISNHLQGLNAHRYEWQISGGCQEWMEAVSFEHYLTTGSILSFDAAASQLRTCHPTAPGVGLTREDYILGIFDMTGELMRFAITTMAISGALPGVSREPGSSGRQQSVLNDLRGLRSALEALDAGHGWFAKDVEKKMSVMKASVEKVEKSLYGLVIRGAERPKGWMPDTETASTSSY